jgi:hypothetical protein
MIHRKLVISNIGTDNAFFEYITKVKLLFILIIKNISEKNLFIVI